MAKINVLAMEYPGYSIYKSQEASEEAIIKDAEKMMRFLKDHLRISMSQILIMGRSIGSGPATYIAQKFKPAALLLISPFTSIKEVAKSMYGFVGALFVKDRFDNLERIRHLSSPVLLIHGKIDKTVPWEHSEALYGNFF